MATQAAQNWSVLVRPSCEYCIRTMRLHSKIYDVLWFKIIENKNTVYLEV